MACKGCEERRQAMKAYIAAKLEAAKHWAQVRAGLAAAGPAGTTDEQAQAATAKSGASPDQDRPAASDKPAGKAGAAHGKRRVAKAAGGGARS